MPTLSLYIPLSRSRGVVLRLAAILAPRPDTARSVPRGHVDLPAYLKKDVGLPIEVERPLPPHVRLLF
ncbi:hypothetical protein [Tateyamaria sp. ANG-S1]|uniref:hypothetical protein n=1 Tax=Tateyamaria sp. ANG-S1 TaxID=1577905 RepID=UPI00057D2E2B|nr:hypothetical protein [Tateyamaria sp. ANG-S1]KIC45434.1 hypothetical protein RA29_20990 [Tateyamaria sp. ANG-S1]